MWKRSLAVSATASLVAAALAAPAAARAGTIEWKPCATMQASGRQILCGLLEVPLDYGDPGGRKIRIAVSRLVHTDDAGYQGVILVNPGGPGGSGLSTAAGTSASLPPRVAARYDWIGFDPRGVGSSLPQVTCDPGYMYPADAPRPDYVPEDTAAEQAWLARAKAFADDCATRHGDLLPHLSTENSARDMESIREALNVEKISYYGYSYGTYLGAVYTTLFPDRVGRMVLDGVVKPSDVWYEANLEQNKAFEKRFDAFFAWVARHDARFRLGDTPRRVQLAYYGMRAALKTGPVGRIGPSEFDDSVLKAGYGSWSWAKIAERLSAWHSGHDLDALRALVGPPSATGPNEYTMYLAVECRDAAWPTDWDTWRYDALKQYRGGYRYNVWANTWFNAPCMFWPAPGGAPPRVGGTSTAMLLTAATDDAATPYPGAVETHRLFGRSRLAVEQGGGNHADSTANPCMRALIAAYLDEGDLPPDTDGPDAVCASSPDPAP
ncbi:alpha/beta hydrolase [Actinocorallia longicatena]|uniref:Alpha/beta hydrolase n=1 Tax=Actinocorallia longicatena TaxID=111803 RepID=A0ABP6PYU6_9ACTN